MITFQTDHAISMDFITGEREEGALCVGRRGGYCGLPYQTAHNGALTTTHSAKARLSKQVQLGVFMED